MPKKHSMPKWLAAGTTLTACRTGTKSLSKAGTTWRIHSPQNRPCTCFQRQLVASVFHRSKWQKSFWQTPTAKVSFQCWRLTEKSWTVFKTMSSKILRSILKRLLVLKNLTTLISWNEMKKKKFSCAETTGSVCIMIRLPRWRNGRRSSTTKCTKPGLKRLKARPSTRFATASASCLFRWKTTSNSLQNLRKAARSERSWNTWWLCWTSRLKYRLFGQLSRSLVLKSRTANTSIAFISFSSSSLKRIRCSAQFMLVMKMVTWLIILGLFNSDRKQKRSCFNWLRLFFLISTGLIPARLKRNNSRNAWSSLCNQEAATRTQTSFASSSASSIGTSKEKQDTRLWKMCWSWSSRTLQTFSSASSSNTLLSCWTNSSGRRQIT